VLEPEADIGVAATAQLFAWWELFLADLPQTGQAMGLHGQEENDQAAEHHQRDGRQQPRPDVSRFDAKSPCAGQPAAD